MANRIKLSCSGTCPWHAHLLLCALVYGLITQVIILAQSCQRDHFGVSNIVTKETMATSLERHISGQLCLRKSSLCTPHLALLTLWP